MKFDELLTIDVNSELLTLCEAQLRGTWQVPAELIRLAIRGGGTEISVGRRKGGIVARWLGATVACDELRHLATVLDVRCLTGERQRAIARLELAGSQALLWAAGLSGARMSLDVTADGLKTRFEHRAKGRPALKKLRANGGADQVELFWSCKGLDRDQAVDWLRSATRFAPQQVEVDGHMTPLGFPDGLYHLQLNTPVPCRLGLTRTGDDPLLWLLRDGVVSARATVPGYPPFQAAVELNEVVSPFASAADMRRAVNPFLKELIDRAVWMMIRVADDMPKLSEEDRQRLSYLLLQAVLRRLREEEVRRLPLIPLAGNRQCLLSLVDLDELANRSGRSLQAIDQADNPREMLIDPEATIQVSNEERNLLAEILGTRFVTAPKRRHGLMRRAFNCLRAVFKAFKERLRGFLGSKALSDSQLRPAERKLLVALRSAIAPQKVDFCIGSGSVRRRSRGLRIPMKHPVVRAGAEAVDRDPAWLYPVLLSIGSEEISTAVRERWLKLDHGSEYSDEH